MTDLEALSKLASEATPGPWRFVEPHSVIHSLGARFGEAMVPVAAIDGLYSMRHRNAAYIAAASPDVMLAVIAMLNAHHRGLTVSGDGPEKCAICAGLNR